ncbi:MAG: S-layer homology domain-containing protein [Clostridia bacterium]|nr:S-layer homology domain-containing protein [Clostridia bacterium]
MKKWKSILSAALAGIMILSTVVSVGAANVSFTDISSHWAKSQINYLVSKDVLNGYKQNNGTYIFKPDGTVTRAEFIKMLDETFGLTATAPINYSDVKASDWFHPYISKAAAQGYLLNYGTSISPNGQLTREEATTLLVRYLGLLGSAKADVSSFTDYNQISSHFRDPVMIAVKAGLINGYQEKNGTYTFRPQNTLTRAEALTILYRAAGAVYNTSAYAKDSAAPADNAVITRGGVTLSGLKLNGRVIVTEGASDAVINFTECTINDTLFVRGAAPISFHQTVVAAMEIDSIAPDISISLGNNTRIQSLTVNSKTGLYIPSGCQINELIINDDAKGVRITGNGTIHKLFVYATGLESTILPDEFNIASGLTANLASQVYSGSSEDQTSFASIPYVSSVDGYYYLNLCPIDNGRIYYYFTNQAYTPTTEEFYAVYASANYNDSFNVLAYKNYSEYTYTENQVQNYEYVVIQLESDSHTYAPIRIENTASTGSGFSVDPYYNGMDIVFTAGVAGTLQYYYSSSSDKVSTAQFDTNFKNVNNSRKNTETVHAGKSDTLELNESILSDYPFVVILLKNANGQKYNPVIIAAGDNGFKIKPHITTIGTIEYESSVNGTMYYYYTDSDKVPTPNDFFATYRTEHGNSKNSVVKNKTGILTYDADKAEKYPYIVFCIEDNSSNQFTPFLLEIAIDTGFIMDPQITGSTEITFKPKNSGTVFWYFSKSSNIESSEAFMNAYHSSASGRRGTVSARPSSVSYFTFDPTYTQSYPYIILMLVDTDGLEYHPVVVDVMNSTNSGFTQGPYCDLSNSRIYFKASGNGRVYYYYSRSAQAYFESSEDFWDTYNSSSFHDYENVTATLTSISFDDIDPNDYPGIVLMYVDDNDNESAPVYVSLKKDTSAGNSTSGITVLSITSSSIKLSVTEAGILYYRESNSKTPSIVGARSIQVSDNGTITLTLSGEYNYIILELDGYETIVVDITENYDRNDEVDDGSNTSGHGFSNSEWDLNGEVTFTAIAQADGIVTLSITPFLTTENVNVKKGEIFTITIPVDIDQFINNGIDQLFNNCVISVQLTASNGDIYERLTIEY